MSESSCTLLRGRVGGGTLLAVCQCDHQCHGTCQQVQTSSLLASVAICAFSGQRWNSLSFFLTWLAVFVVG